MTLTATEVRLAWRLALDYDALLSSFSKPDLAAVVSAIDDWCTANATSFNTAIPQPQRGLMTTQQKSILLAVVAMKRTGVL